MSDEETHKGVLNCSALKAIAKEGDLSLGDEALNQLGMETKLLLAKAMRRAKENKRQQIKGRDV